MNDHEPEAWYQRSGDGFTIEVHAVPGASRSEVVGTHGDALRIRLAAPPVDGKANDQLIRFLAAALQIPRSAVAIETGHRGRRKRVRVTGVSARSLTDLVL